jgi:hypothetical protein
VRKDCLIVCLENVGVFGPGKLQLPKTNSCLKIVPEFLNANQVPLTQQYKVSVKIESLVSSYLSTVGIETWAVSRHFEAVKYPGNTECNDNARVKSSPGKAVEPCGYVGFHDRAVQQTIC